MLGLPAAQVLGKTDADFPPPEQAAFFREKDRATLERGTPEHIPCEPIDSPGLGRRLLHIIKVPAYDEQGRPRYLIGISEDITECLRVEEELRMHQFALDHASEGVEWLDRDGRFLYVNHTTCARLGYTVEELLAMRVMDIAPEITAEAWPLLWENIKQVGKISMESFHRCKDGTSIPVEVSASYLEFGGTPYLFAFVRDISERRQAEAQLQMFATLADNAPDAIGIADPNGVITYANPAFRAMFGYGDATIGMINTTLFSEADQREHIPVLPVAASLWKHSAIVR